MFVTGLLLAAGSSQRLGQPKQLLPYRGAPLLAAALGTARAAGFGQLLVVLGGAAEEVQAAVDLEGAEVVLNVEHGSGCSSSIAAALAAVPEAAAGLVLMLGDQPDVRPAAVADLLDAAAACDVAVCRYEDGWGHPMWFSRSTFGDLAELHGDKGVWRLLHSGRYDVREVATAGTVPLDVDTRQDYLALLAADAPKGSGR